MDGLSQLLTGGGRLESACVTLSGGAFSPFAYVIPSPAPDATHAAFYSATHRPSGPSRLEAATGTLGLRDGRPFFHCHALWTEADGRQGCGHVLADDTVVSAPVRVQGAGIVGARFEIRPDAETGFSLFMPQATGTAVPADAQPAVAVRLAPNQDLTAALEQAGRRAGFRRAVLHGGVASLIGGRFADAAPVEGFAAEMLVRRGTVRCVADGGAPTELDIAMVDLHGTVRAGRLVAGDNPILMTFEGVLAAA